MQRFDSYAIHTALGAQGWVEVLTQAGIDSRYLRDAHGPCPICGGKDRFRFDNKGRGSWFCNSDSHGRAGDGFKLVMTYLGLDFVSAVRKVVELGRLNGGEREPAPCAAARTPFSEKERTGPTQRVIRLLREACAVEDCESALIYLKKRRLWPLPPGHRIKAHPSLEYWHKGQIVGRLPAIVLEVRDIDSELVTAHVTYLDLNGNKAQLPDPEMKARKILSKMTGHVSCMAHLMPLDGPVMGIGEGWETCISAWELFRVPVWSALNAGLIEKFTPPPGITRVIYFADRDVQGMLSVMHSMNRLQGRVSFDFRVPKAMTTEGHPLKDWNDVVQLCDSVELTTITKSPIAAYTQSVQ